TCSCQEMRYRNTIATVTAGHWPHFGAATHPTEALACDVAIWSRRTGCTEALGAAELSVSGWPWVRGAAATEQVGGASLSVYNRIADASANFGLCLTIVPQTAHPSLFAKILPKR